jgi:Cys-tRNA(Pro)/Cys-tRNA(Cys) deacylase
MTPAIKLAQKAKISFSIHEYVHDSNHDSYGLEAAQKLGVEASRVFKTLVVKLDTGMLAVAIIPVAAKLNLKTMAKACSAKRATMADPKDVERSSGYVLGGVSPLGQKKRLLSVIDNSATNFESIFVSAGKRGLEIELAPSALEQLISAQYAALAN